MKRGALEEKGSIVESTAHGLLRLGQQEVGLGTLQSSLSRGHQTVVSIGLLDYDTFPTPTVFYRNFFLKKSLAFVQCTMDNRKKRQMVDFSIAFVSRMNSRKFASLYL